MIDGITVLNETTKWTVYSNIQSTGIVLICMAVFFFIIFLVGIKCKSEGMIAIGIIIAILGGFLGYCFLEAYSQRIKYKEYKVTIDDTVKLIEFNNKYNIISKEGKIYTIIEKE